jgi:malonyl CoA-acyl carrier protein transacylase
MPIWLLYPKKNQVTNLLVPVCSSASHVTYATVRMEPQLMMLGHAAGVIAALSVSMGLDAVQDVDKSAVSQQLRADGQLLSLEDDSASGGTVTTI